MAASRGAAGRWAAAAAAASICEWLPRVAVVSYGVGGVIIDEVLGHLGWNHIAPIRVFLFQAAQHHNVSIVLLAPLTHKHARQLLQTRTHIPDFNNLYILLTLLRIKSINFMIFFRNRFRLSLDNRDATGVACAPKTGKTPIMAVR